MNRACSGSRCGGPIASLPAALAMVAALVVVVGTGVREAAAYVLAGPGAVRTGRSTLWSWQDPAGYLAAYRESLANAANFGPAGAVPVAVSTVDLADVTPLSLAAADGFIAPFWNDGDVPTAARDALVDFFLAGGDLVLLQDSVAHDAIGSALGLPVRGASLDPLWNGSGAPFDGPFGAVTNVVQQGLAGRLSATEVSLLGGEVVATNEDGQVTVAFWDEGSYRPGAGNLVVVTDTDTWSTWMGSANYALIDSEARFALNATAAIVIECGDGALDPGEGCDDGDIVDGDGCDSNCRPTACGNDLRTPGEQCDDGGVANGDGCSAACVCEAVADADGDGYPDACDDCPGVADPAQDDSDRDGAGDACDSCPADPADDADGDGSCGDADFCPFDDENDLDLDGLCADVDPCTNPAGERDIAERGKLAFRFVYLDPTPHNDRLAFSAEFALPLGVEFGDLDPRTSAVRFRVEFDDGTSPVDVWFPTSTFDGAGTAGWLLNGPGSQWVFRDRTDAPESGVVLLTLKQVGDGSSSRVHVKVRGVDSDYLVTPGDTPLRAIVSVGDASLRECAEANFTSRDCRTTSLGQIVSCRN